MGVFAALMVRRSRQAWKTADDNEAVTRAEARTGDKRPVHVHARRLARFTFGKWV